MPTERQSESARINGAKSHGPESAEGKKKSSRNSLRHGCTAGHTILLACEDRGDFNRMRKDYDAMYKPVTLEEQNLVAEMFATAWRLRRATTIETALIDLEVVTEEPKLKARFDTVDGGILLASAFRSLADESRSLALVLRYEARLRRIHQQNYDMLLRVRQERQSEPAPPEPPPAPAPTPDLDQAPDALEVCAPPAADAPPPAIPLTPMPEARCSHENKIGVGQAVRLPNSSKNRILQKQNEPAAQRFSRRERKIFHTASRKCVRMPRA